MSIIVLTAVSEVSLLNWIMSRTPYIAFEKNVLCKMLEFRFFDDICICAMSNKFYTVTCLMWEKQYILSADLSRVLVRLFSKAGVLVVSFVHYEQRKLTYWTQNLKENYFRSRKFVPRYSLSGILISLAGHDPKIKSPNSLFLWPGSRWGPLHFDQISNSEKHCHW